MNLRIRGKVLLDKTMCFLTRNAQLFTQSEIRLTINNTEIYRLCTAAHGSVDILLCHIENLHCCFCMNIDAVIKGFDHLCLIRHVRQHP